MFQHLQICPLLKLVYNLEIHTHSPSAVTWGRSRLEWRVPPRWAGCAMLSCCPTSESTVLDTASLRPGFHVLSAVGGDSGVSNSQAQHGHAVPGASRDTRPGAVHGLTTRLAELSGDHAVHQGAARSLSRTFQEVHTLSCSQSAPSWERPHLSFSSSLCWRSPVGTCVTIDMDTAGSPSGGS